MTASQIHIDLGWAESKAIITPSCAEQGIVKAISIVAILRSLLVSKVLVTIVAILPHPTARTNGMTDLPLNPIFLNPLSTRRASLGKYPLSSRSEKTMKKRDTIGKIIPKP